ncbi:uncharacterized protein LOC126844408 [Adelges cooleyi]|uniref:uncharacterized protein LOC126844408 n=1 Tax=Adelges cooleyi TaxID=133065 RepID=UPI00217FF9F2|nr:uncharacterized protein LOC126844408 [Adelges cooleyi]
MNLIMKPLNPKRIAGIILVCLFQITCTPIVEAITGGHNIIQGIHWIYKYQDEVVYDADAVGALYDIETLAQDAYQIDSGDIERLTTPCEGDKQCAMEKTAAIVKYNSKVECIQCMNAVLMTIIVPKVYDGDHRIKRQVTLKSVSRGSVNQYKRIVWRMLSLMYFFKVQTHNYLWHLFLRVSVAENPAVYEKVAKDSKGKEMLMSELAQHLDLCRQNNYLPANYGLTPANQADEDKQVIVLGRKLYEVNQPDDPFLSSVYDFADQFDIKFLSLSHTYPDEDDLLEKSGIQINWENTKLLFNVNKPDGLHAFVLRPFDFTGYHRLAMRAVQANLLYLAWIHCAMLQDMLDQSLPKIAIDASTTRKLNVFHKQLTAPLSTAVRDLGLEDPVFENFIVNLEIIINKDIDFIRSFASQAAAMIEEVKNIVLEDLRELGVSSHHAQTLFDSPLLAKMKMESNTSELTYFEHIANLRDYAGIVKNIMAPVDFNFVKYFLAGKSKLYETFYFEVLRG